MAGLLGVDELFEGRHFDREVIVLCVRWYLRFKLSYRDLVEMMAERGLSLAHTTIMRWVRHYVLEFERRWNRFARPAGSSWRIDETYVKGTGAKLGVRRQWRLAGKSRWLDGISVHTQNQTYHCRPRTEPEAAGRHRAATIAFADYCSSGGSPGNWLSLR